jgi:hypothetical protein
MQQFSVVRANAACWEGYERVPGTTEFSNDSCRKKGSGEKKKKKKRKREKGEKKSAKKSRENASTVPGKGGIHAKGADAGASAVTCPVFFVLMIVLTVVRVCVFFYLCADGDGKTGEGKKKKSKESWKKDDDGDGVPNAIDKVANDSDSDSSEYSSSSDEE